MNKILKLTSNHQPLLVITCCNISPGPQAAAKEVTGENWYLLYIFLRGGC